MKIWTVKAIALFTAVFGLMSISEVADAGILPIKVTVTPDGPNFRYTYGIMLTSDSKLTPGDYFTIYDFYGYIPGSISSDGLHPFTYSVSNVGTTPLGTVPFDDPNVPNLTFIYNGSTELNGQIGLGNFWALSPYNLTTEGAFTARSHRQVDSKVDSNITDTLVPSPDVPPPQVPEPATLTMLGLGLPLIGAVRYLRRRNPVPSVA